MNRIQPLPTQVAPPSGTTTAGVASAHYQPAHGGSHRAIFAPLHYEANYAYPLLVWLHGPGDDESQLKRVMPMISMRNFVAVAVRGMPRAAGKRGFGWSQRRADVATAEQCVFDAIDAARARFNIADRRVFVAGFDCGGTMAFRLAMDHPRHFAGVLSLGGSFPAGRTPFAQLAQARRLPIFLACGRDSETYSAAEVCEHLRLFHSAGISVTLRQYPCGHDLTTLMLADVNRWIMEQVTSEPVAANPH
jgi:phospholipase/carboxylesterase